MIGQWFILSYLFGASNMRFKNDMINISYPASISYHQTNHKLLILVIY